jgi:uncharacterized protein YjbI with pentapeptide repeats
MVLAVLVLLAVVVVVLWIFSAPIAQGIHSAQSFDAVTFLKEHVLALAMLTGCLVIFGLIWLPKWQAARPELTMKERFEVENEARKTLAQIVGGAAVLVGLYFTWSSIEVSREGQVTERFTHAIDQLGSDKSETRVGGIYALERIARNSERDHWPIMEVLTAYVRDNAPWPPEKALSSKDDQPKQSVKKTMGLIPRQISPKPSIDIQAILTVLGRRKRAYEKVRERWLQQLDLSWTDLRGAVFWGAHLEGANLQGAHLDGADLRLAAFTAADFEDAHLEGAILQGTRLEGANFRRAYLDTAIVEMAQLEGADMTGVRLRGADLSSANLKHAHLGGAHMERAELDGAYLEGTSFAGAQLEGADFWGAQLKGALLADAQLKGANFEGAHLDGAYLWGANLQGVKNLTVEQLSTVRTLHQALIDPPLRAQIEQRHRHLLEKPRE